MITDFLRNNLTKYLYGRDEEALQAFQNICPEKYYIGLSSAKVETIKTGTITGEPSGNNYQRIEIPNDTDHFQINGNGIAENINPIEWPASGDNGWGKISTVFITYASDVGEGEALYCVTVDKQVDANCTLSIGAGAITLGICNEYGA